MLPWPLAAGSHSAPRLALVSPHVALTPNATNSRGYPIQFSITPWRLVRPQLYLGDPQRPPALQDLKLHVVIGLLLPVLASELIVAPQLSEKLS